MIERYSREEIKSIWSLESKFNYFLKVELAVCEAYSLMGQIYLDDLKQIKKLAKFDLKRIAELEEETGHDVIAFLTCVNENLGDLAKYMHVGMTSSDVIDTALSLQLKDAGKIIVKDLNEIISTIKKLAEKHKKTICMGRSHGIHAEIMTFGVKLCSWIDEFERIEKNFLKTLEQLNVGQISGPVGTYSNISPEVEELALKKLGLKPAKISTQILPRDYHAYFMQNLAMIATIIEQFATELRHLQRTEVREVEEGFKKGQKGSSAMPHKKNPISAENLCGLARVVRSNSMAAFENVALWHERDISHSSVERVIAPDSTILVDFILARLERVIGGLEVFPERMKKNMEASHGLYNSQEVMLSLARSGMTREDAYRIVQNLAMRA